MSTEKPISMSHGPDAGQTTETVKFDAIAALAQTYAKQMHDLTSPSVPRLFFEQLRREDAQNWLEAEALLEQSRQDIVTVIEVAKFGGKGWVNLRRTHSKSGGVDYTLQLVDSASGKEVATTSVDRTVVAEAILRSVSQLAAALASEPEFRSRVSKFVLPEGDFSRFESSAIEGFAKKVDARSKQIRV